LNIAKENFKKNIHKKITGFGYLSNGILFASLLYLDVKKAMRITLLFIFLLISFQLSTAQVMGLSASKLGTYNTETVPVFKIEFEPFFEVVSAKKAYDADGLLHTINYAPDENFISSSAGFRFTYGAIKNFEIGAILPTDISSASIGIKYRLPFKTNTGFALLAGLNAPFDAQSITRTYFSVNNTTALAYGLALSKPFSEKFSMDANIQTQNYLRKTDKNHFIDMFISTDWGYFVKEGFQCIVGLGYSLSDFEDNSFNSQEFTVIPGFTLEKAESFIIVFGFPLTVYGKNTELTRSTGFALTIVLD
jgi:hypothetical protein